MKTENLTFIEAVQALKDGKCEGIKRPDYNGHITGDYNFDDGTRFYMCHAAFLATDWQLVNPIVETEEREVKEYAVVRKTDGYISLHFDSREEAQAKADYYSTFSPGEALHEVVELTGSYCVPVKEKERKSYTMENAGLTYVNGCSERRLRPWVDHDEFPVPMERNLRITFEWED